MIAVLNDRVYELRGGERRAAEERFELDQIEGAL
jgi:hypothetical protein